MPRHNNVYHYDDKTFSSIKALAAYTGINEKTLTARLRRGMSMEAACQKQLFNCTYYMDGGIVKSLSQVCIDHGKDAGLVRNRLKRNYSLNKALNSPKKIAKQGKPVVVNGILYNSIAEAARKLGLSHKESTIRSRLRAGWNNNDAFNFEAKVENISSNSMELV